MKIRIAMLAAACLLSALVPARQLRAEDYNFALVCAFKPQEWRTVVVSGDYVTGEATISHPDGTLRRAFVAFDGDRGGAPPKLAVLVKGKGRSEWRDLYIIDTALGTFTHVNEVYADGPDKQPSMVVQGGTCKSAR
jgi:hypothetical protein